MVQPPAVSSELVAQLQLLGLWHIELIQLVHASEYLLHVHHPSALTALTTARRSHNTSPSIEAPLPLMSVNNSIAVYRVICLFQAHELSENSLVKCTSVSARVSCAVTENRVPQGSGSCTSSAHKRLYSTCAFCAFVEVFTPFEFNKISGFWSSGLPPLSWFMDFT